MERTKVHLVSSQSGLDGDEVDAGNLRAISMVFDQRRKLTIRVNRGAHRLAAGQLACRLHFRNRDLEITKHDAPDASPTADI